MPRKGTELSKNLDLNGLVSVFDCEFKLIPDKIPNRKLKT